MNPFPPNHGLFTTLHAPGDVLSWRPWLSDADWGLRSDVVFNLALQAPEDLRIKQATMTMVPYPAMYPMPVEVQLADLLYEAAHIGDEGPAMTHSMLAIDWLAMKNKSGGDLEFQRSYNTNVFGPYRQWMECPVPPDFCQGHRPATNFLTAAGGFTQTIFYGYLGLRYNDDNMTIAPALMKNATGLAFRGLSWNNTLLDIVYSATEVTISMIPSAEPLVGTTEEEGKEGEEEEGLFCVFADSSSPPRPLSTSGTTISLPATIAVARCSSS